MDTDKLYGDLEFLRIVAQHMIGMLQDEDWWREQAALFAQYPGNAPYDLVNRAEFADALNTLYGAVNPDTDNDTAQDLIYKIAAGLEKPLSEDYVGEQADGH